MPSTSMQNIQAKPSMRITRFSPSAGSHSISWRSTSPSAICGNSNAVCMAQPNAITPARVDSVLRALAGSIAAIRLPMKGRSMRVIRGMGGPFYGQGFLLRYENLSMFQAMAAHTPRVVRMKNPPKRVG